MINDYSYRDGVGEIHVIEEFELRRYVIVMVNGLSYKDGVAKDM